MGTLVAEGYRKQRWAAALQPRPLAGGLGGGRLFGFRAGAFENSFLCGCGRGGCSVVGASAEGATPLPRGTQVRVPAAALQDGKLDVAGAVQSGGRGGIAGGWYPVMIVDTSRAAP